MIRQLERSEDFRQAGVDVDLLPEPLPTAFEIGFQTGEPALFLERLAPVLSRAAVWRRTLMTAWVYPFIIILLAAAALIFVVTWARPMTAALALEISPTAKLPPQLLQPGARVAHWTLFGLVVALVGIGGRLLFRWRRGGADLLPSRLRQPLLNALFSDMLAALVAHRIALDRAIPLAAAATQDGKMIQAAKELAAKIRSGVDNSRALRVSGLPARLTWLLVSAATPERLGWELEILAKDYRSLGRARFERWRIWFPACTIALFGGAAVFAVGYSVLMSYLLVVIRVLNT